MKLLYPDLAIKKASALDAGMLRAMGVKALILDADNTLSTHNNPEPDPEILLWIERMRGANIPMVIVSNNRGKRIRPFAERLAMPFTANALKPIPKGFYLTAQKLGLPPHEIGVVGDQIFTDVLGGNLFGAKTILVSPIEPETGLFFRLKRKAEVAVLRRYRKYAEGRK